MFLDNQGGIPDHPDLLALPVLMDLLLQDTLVLLDSLLTMVLQVPQEWAKDLRWCHFHRGKALDPWDPQEGLRDQQVPRTSNPRVPSLQRRRKSWPIKSCLRK